MCVITYLSHLLYVCDLSLNPGFKLWFEDTFVIKVKGFRNVDALLQALKKR